MKHPIEILERYWGHSTFRPNQLEIIETVLENKDCLALLPTSGGKSVCFQVPALIKEGICIVISPLIALMQDQVESLKEKGIKAIALTNIDSRSELDRILDNCVFGNYKFLYISPERLENNLVQERIKAMAVNLIAVDEAHCISQWGHDFRPAYRKIKNLRSLCPDAAVIALTATATKAVVKDIFEQLDFIQPKIFQSSFYRGNLSYNCIQTEDTEYKTMKLLNETKGSAIIYVRSRIATEQIAKVLDNNGISSGYYHGGLDSKIKETVYSNWKSHKFRVMVATNAFGMGIDKSDVGLVIHLSIPGSLEAYFQESGRAGRNGKKAKAVLIMGPNSVEDTRKWFRNQIPEIVFLKLIYKKLCAYFQIAYGEFGRTQMGLKFDEFCQLYKVSKLKTFTALKLLERHGILVFETFYKNKISLQFLVSNKLLQQHIKNQSIKNLIVNTILRTCEGVFERSTVIDVKKIANKTGLKNNQIIQVLEQFKSEEIAAFENRQTDAQITFLVPREDDKTIHAISKSINHQNKIKLDKLKAVLAFAQNNTNCKSVQLLNYFGEKDPIRCKVCNVCDAADARQKHFTQEDIERVYKTLEKRTLTSRELVDICNLEPEKVFFILRYLLENKMINLTATNQYQIL